MAPTARVMRAAARWGLSALTTLAALSGCDESVPPHLGAVRGPWLNVTQPTEGALLTGSTLEVAGQAHGLRRLEVGVDARPPREITPAADAHWSLAFAVSPGPHTVTVRAYGADGVVAETVRQVYQGWATPLEPPAPRDVATLPVDAATLRAQLPPAALAAVVAHLDLRAWAAAGLDRAQDHPAVAAWRQPLWQVAVEQTPLAPLVTAVAPFGLSGTRVLSDLMGAAPEAPLLPTEALASALIEGLWAEHPATPDAAHAVPVTLGEVLEHLGSWPARWGPVGLHPGVFSHFEARLLAPGFRIALHLEPRGRALPGLDRAGHAAEHFEAEGPARVAIQAPRRADITGLLAEPRASATLPLSQAEAPVPAGPMGPEPRGGSPVWALPAWTVERIAAEAAFATWRAAEPQAVAWRVGAIDPAAEITTAAGRVQMARSDALGLPASEFWIWSLVVDAVQAGLEPVPPLVFSDVPLAIAPDAVAEALLDAVETHAEHLATRLAPAADPGPAVLWLDGETVRFAEGFAVYPRPSRVGAPLRAATPGTDATLYAEGAQGPVAIRIEAGPPVVVQWVPLEVVP